MVLVLRDEEDGLGNAEKKLETGTRNKSKDSFCLLPFCFTLLVLLVEPYKNAAGKEEM